MIGSSSPRGPHAGLQLGGARARGMEGRQACVGGGHVPRPARAALLGIDASSTYAIMRVMRARGRHLGLFALGALSACTLVTSLDALQGGGGGGGGPSAAQSTGTVGGGSGQGGDASTDALGPGCDGGLVPCGDRCVDATVDPAHCGGCDHACGGAACKDGLCEPTALISGPKGPHGIAVAGDAVYFTAYSEGTVRKIPTTGGPADTLASGQGLPSMIALSSTTLFWTTWDDGAIRSVPLQGGTLATLVTGEYSTFGVAIDKTSVFWGTYSAGALKRAPLTGGPVEPLYIGAHIVLVAADGGDIYWTDDGDGTVDKRSADGSIVTLAAAQSGPWGLALDTDSVYFSNQAAGTVNKVPKAGGSVTMLVAGLTQPRCIAVDNGFVYFANYGGNTVGKVAAGGGEAVTLAKNQAGPLCLAVDTTSVYWTNYANDTVMKVTK